MARYLLPLLLFLLGADAGAQNEVLERSFGIEIQPQFNQRRISGTANSTVPELERIDSLEEGTFGYGLGFVYESRVDRIGFTTGLRYTRAGYGTTERTLAGGTQTFSDRIVAHYIAVPVEVNFYQNATERDRVFFLLGLAPQFHLGTRVNRTLDGTTERLEDDTDYRGIVLSFNTGFGYDRKLSDDWALRIQPNFQFFLNGNIRPDADTRANRNYYQVGLRLVLRRLFI